MFVPVGVGERQGGAIVKKPDVFSCVPDVVEADPVKRAAVGASLIQ